MKHFLSSQISAKWLSLHICTIGEEGLPLANGTHDSNAKVNNSGLLSIEPLD